MFACTLFGIDRQVYYRKIKRSIIKQDKASLVVEMVLEIRRQMPRIGSKKLYYLLNKDLQTLHSSNKCNWVKINKLFFQKKGQKSPFL